jgi:hypothetical protein
MDKERSIGVTVISIFEMIGGVLLLFSCISYMMNWRSNGGGLGELGNIPLVVAWLVMAGFCFMVGCFTYQLKPEAKGLNFVLVLIVLLASFANLLFGFKKLSLFKISLPLLGIIFGLLTISFVKKQFYEFVLPLTPEEIKARKALEANLKLGRGTRIVFLLIIFGMLLGFAMFPLQILNFLLGGWTDLLYDLTPSAAPRLG